MAVMNIAIAANLRPSLATDVVYPIPQRASKGARHEVFETVAADKAYPELDSA